VPISSSLKNSIFRTGIDEKSSIRPLSISLIVSISYILIVSLYIWISGIYASEISSTLEKLKNIELIKGLIYAIVTGTGLFVTLFIILLKIKKKDETIIAQNKSIISSEGLVISGLFASSVSHDINNFLHVITSYSELLKATDHLSDTEKEYVSNISAATENLKKLSKRMMDAGKGYLLDKKELADLTHIAKETIDFAKIHNKVNGCNLRYELPDELKMNINPLLFSRTLMNLILNSAEANPHTGEILVRLKEDNDIAVLEVHDNGPGIPEEIKENILNPFFTTKKTGNGLGLLSLKIFADQHNGVIDIRDSELGGACFSISFPRNQTII
jgi:signal transduction histidine kinase